MLQAQKKQVLGTTTLEQSLVLWTKVKNEVTKNTEDKENKNVRI